MCDAPISGRTTLASTSRARRGQKAEAAMAMMYDPTSEAMTREALDQLQLERLQATVLRAYRNVRFYHQLLDDRRIDPEAVCSLADLRSFPFTTKEDLRRAYPYDMFAVPLREI